MTNKAYSMINVAPTVSATLGLPAPSQAKGEPIQEIVVDLVGVSRVAVLAPDALGMFAWGLWKEEMPYLRSLHERNSVTLRSVMPSITPVNFAAMVTGTDLSGHGVHAREEDFSCETLFDVVRRAGGLSAGIGLAGYTGSELLGRYADIWGNAGDGSDDGVADQIIQITDAHLPMFLIAQFGRVDDVFHRHGPSSPAVVPMLKDTDARMKRLVEHLKPLGYGVVILADHGQQDVADPTPGGLKGSHGTDRPEDCLVPCTWI
jgi:predicted AlkP superfamily pyrophosphatase or phosphodiesterase